MSEQFDFPIEKFHFKSNSIFEGLPKEDEEFIKSTLVVKEYKKGAMLFIEGSYPSGIFYLIEGKVKKFKADKEGREHIIYICNSGELLGYPALLSEETFSDSASAIEKTIIGFMSKKDFLYLIDKSSTISKRLIKNLSHEFAVLENSILSISHKNVRERLALSLLILRDKYRTNETKDDKIEIILSREDLANTIGTAVETLVRLLREFKDENLIETEGRKIRILNPKKLLEVANL